MNSRFHDAYKELNKAQKEAVDTIDGPVMVVAGPGTGKTQILSLRIANILEKTDTGASGVLCLTFTNSGVSAMRKRLLHYIGNDANKVRIATFHSFGLDYIQKYFSLLDFDFVPELLDETQSVAIADELFENHDWEYLRPRANSTQYFRDVKSLIGLLKREHITPEQFLFDINFEIDALRTDPASISTRGESKGSLKKEIEKKIESLNRTREVVTFYELYEAYKKEQSYIDYDDVLRLLVRLVQESDDVASEIRESFLYVLVDEHQDSSGVQNEFLESVWKEVDRPNIFVVGDDRQLIYGFGGASLSYFENFKTLFGKATLITLTENYRSTQTILDAAHALLQSSIAPERLISNRAGDTPITFYEVMYPRDEIILAGTQIKEVLEKGIDPNECAILVPKNYQVRSAVTILRDMSIPVASGGNTDLFLSRDAGMVRTVLRIVANPYDNVSIAEYVLSRYSEIPPLEAHRFIHESDSYTLSIDTLRARRNDASLFGEEDAIVKAGNRLSDYISYGTSRSVYETVQYVGETLLLDTADGHDELVVRAEVVRTLLHLVLSRIEKNPDLTLSEFLMYLDRLESYGETIPLAVFGKDQGIKVMTLHGSKGLEFDFVWIAHMDENSLMKGKKNAFTLPEKIQDMIEEKDELVIKRQIYVALTRARSLCNLSYARESYTGASLEQAHIFSEIPESLLRFIPLKDSESILLEDGPEKFVTKNNTEEKSIERAELVEIVKSQYDKVNVSVTLLNNFFECPWKWYFRNLLKLPEVKSSSLLFGSVVHESIEKILKSETLPHESDYDRFIIESIKKNSIHDPNEIRRIHTDARVLLLQWMNVRFPELSKNRESERSLSYKNQEFPHLKFYGKIDLTERLSPGEARVTDFKTGSPKSKSLIEKRDEEGRLSNYLRQLAMYSYLMQGSERTTHVIQSCLEFVEALPENKDARYVTRIDDEHIDLLKKDIFDYDAFIQSGEWLQRPCNFSGYGQTIECPDCARAKRIYDLK